MGVVILVGCVDTTVDGCIDRLSVCSDGFWVGANVGKKYHRYGPIVSIGTITVGTALGAVDGKGVEAVEESAVELAVKACTGCARGSGSIAL